MQHAFRSALLVALALAASAMAVAQTTPAAAPSDAGPATTPAPAMRSNSLVAPGHATRPARKPIPPSPAREAAAPQPPPAVAAQDAARPVASIALVNPGFESPASGALGLPEGWSSAQHAGPISYTFTLVAESRPGAGRSLKVENVGAEPFGTAYQVLDARPHRDRTLRLSAWMRTEGTVGNPFGRGAGLVLSAMRGGYPVETTQMRNNAVHGSVGWTRYEITLKIPPQADKIEVGVILFGPGKVWLDDVALDIVDSASS